MLKGLKFAVFVLAPLFTFNYPAGAASQNKSYLHFSLLERDFSKALQPMVKHLQSALRAEEEEKKNIELEKSLALGEETFPSLNRSDHYQYYFLFGFTNEHLNREDEALKNYEQAAQLSVRDSRALFRKGLVLQKQKHFIEAIKTFQEVLWQTTYAQDEVLYEIAECFFLLGRQQEALQHATLAREKNPNSLEALALLVKVRLALLPTITVQADRQLLENQIISDLDRLTQLKPDERDSVLLFSRFLAQRSDALYSPQGLERAKKITEKLVKKSEFKDEEAVRLLADIQLKQRDFPAAEKTLTAGMKQTPSSAILKQGKAQLKIQREASKMIQGEVGVDKS